jgi:hypothetical protein
MPISKYGLLEDDPNAGGATGAANVSGVTQNPGANAANLNPFGQARTVTPLGAAAVIPQVQQFAFNPKYAAQSTAIEQALANQDLNRQNQLGAVDADLGRATGEAGRSRDKALEQLINKYASSGILGSGIDAMSRGEMEGNFQRFLGDLQLNAANAKGGIQSAWAQAINAANSQRAGMFGQQQQEEEQARLQQERDLAEAERQQREAAAAAQRHEEMLAQQRAAAAAVQPSYPSMPYAPGAGGGGGAYGGGGGGGGGLGWDMGYAGIGPGDTMQDVQNQINALATAGGVHQLSLMYSSPQFQTPEMAGMKQAVGSLVNRMSTPGDPLYNPANSTYQQPGGFW